ncbi:hypothetical protein [Kineosporia babensis]|uniref:HD domain-containing protein n=1 Tax=Kineosporia babensis TaxID=499548 RepID=A0A9X1NML3_9ACTN|nr:hypothetical protein [Kineosporia babensis]MCD5316865.1 hypothetical protein [Kineosporia babensis]
MALRIADRLHNARTWQFVEPENARARGQETLEFVAPLAAAVALPAARDELLHLSLRTLRRTRPTGRRGRSRLGAEERDRSLRSEHLTHTLLHRALDALPERLRERYAEEWSADLATLTGTLQRIRFAAGLQYSARQLSSTPRS